MQAIVEIYIVQELSIVNRTNESELFGSFSFEKSFKTKTIIVSKGARNAEAATAPIIRLEFNNDFLTNGSPQRPQIKIPSLLVV